MFKRILLIIFLTIADIAISHSQPYCNIRTFNIRDGLAADIISEIAQTKDNILWVATWNGLCCYDGYKFTIFRDVPGKDEVLTTNRLLKIKPDKFNNIWCITHDRQVNLFDTHTCRFLNNNQIFCNKAGIKNLNVHNVYSLNNGYTWVICNCKDKINFRINEAKNPLQDIEIIRGKSIRKVKLDKNSVEWLFTTHGLEQYGGTFHCNIPFEYMQQIGHRIYFASKNDKLGCYEKGKMRMIPLPKDIKSIQCMEKWGKNHILLGTNNGIIEYNNKNRKISRMSVQHPSQPSNDVKKLFVDSRHRIWAFTSGKGVIMLNPATGVTEWLNTTSSISETSTTSRLPFIHEDKHATIWVIPTGGTFSYYNEDTHKLIAFTLHSDQFGEMVLPTIQKIFIDNQDNLWFSGQHDLSIINFKFHDFTTCPLGSVEIRAIYSDRKDRLWVGDDHGQIRIYSDHRQFIGYLNSKGQLQQTKCAFSTKIYGFYEDLRDRMWILTKGDGLYCLSKGKIMHYLHKEKDPYSLSYNNIYDAFQDGKGHLWIATFGTGPDIVQEGKNGKIRFINTRNLLRQYPSAGHKIRRICRSRKGAIIFSTTDGILTCSENFKDPRKIRFYFNHHIQGDSTSLLTNDVLQTCITHNRQIYVSTLGGGIQKIVSSNLLNNHIQLKPMHSIAGSEGLFQSIVEDKQGKLWLIRENALDCYNPKTNKVSNFGTDDMDKRIEFTEAKPAFNPHTGRISLGLAGGFISFLPQKIKKSTYCPRIAFMNVLFQGENNTQPILNATELDVPSSKRNLTITFAALEYSNNDLIHYAYMLEGIDKKWNYVGNAHSASFNNFPEGHHRLLVRSTNADGVWVKNTHILNIYAHPTFWESGWGWTLYILIFVSVIYIALYIIQLRQRNKMEKKMDLMKTNFFMNIGHKLRTPLTLIGEPITEILRQDDLKEEYRKELAMVQRNSRNMLDLVNHMLTYNTDKNYFVDDTNAPIFVNETKKKKRERDTKEGKTTTRHDIKLLIVEDNNDLRNFLTAILSHDYEVINAENGKQGLELAEEQMPDFIITDVMMPVMDGLTMVHLIKQNKDISHIPIIVLSAKASLNDKLQGLKEGIDDYITKPFSATYLKQRVKNIIKQRHLLQQKYLEQMKDIGNSEEKKIFHLQAPEIVDNDKLVMNKLMDYMEEHISDPNLKIEDLADAVNLGRTVFYGKIKAIVGMTPIDFVRHIRIQRAEQLIAKSKDTFSSIAYSVGFADPKYFTKCFKKETGMTPSEYRQKTKL